MTPEEIKRLLSDHYQGTPYDPYARHGDPALRGSYRPIGVNRNNILVLTQLRPGQPPERMALEWIAFGSNVFNAMAPFYANVETVPDYFSYDGKEVTTESFYWTSRLIAALADPHFSACVQPIERYQAATAAKARDLLRRFETGQDGGTREDCNRRVSDLFRRETDSLLARVLYLASSGMKNGFARSDG